MKLENLKIWCSPITGIIYAGYESKGVATQKIDITKIAVNSVMQHMDISKMDYECAAGELLFKSSK